MIGLQNLALIVERSKLSLSSKHAIVLQNMSQFYIMKITAFFIVKRVKVLRNYDFNYAINEISEKL